MSKNIKTFYDLYELIFTDIKISNKYIKQHYHKIYNYKNTDDINNLRNYIKDNIEEKIKSYLNFLQDSKNLMIKKTNGIYEKLEYLFKVTRAFDKIQTGGSPKSNEILNNFKKSYEEYENVFHNFKIFMYSTNTKILKDHQNKIDNLITIYSFIEHLTNHLEFILLSYQKIKEQLFYLDGLNKIVHSKKYVYNAIRSNKINKLMLSKIKEETDKLDSIILLSDYYPEEIKKETIDLQNMVNNSLKKLDDKYKPTAAESLHEQIIELLNNRKYYALLTKEVEDKLLDIIMKYSEKGYNKSIASELHNEIIGLLNNNDREPLTKEIKYRLLELISDIIKKLTTKRRTKK